MILLSLGDILLATADLVNFGVRSSLVSVGLCPSPQVVCGRGTPGHGRGGRERVDGISRVPGKRGHQEDWAAHRLEWALGVILYSMAGPRSEGGPAPGGFERRARMAGEARGTGRHRGPSIGPSRLPLILDPGGWDGVARRTAGREAAVKARVSGR